MGLRQVNMARIYVRLQTRYNGRYNELRWCEPELILKIFLGLDYTLQLAYMKAESLVIVSRILR